MSSAAIPCPTLSRLSDEERWAWERDTWQLEVLPDPDSDADIEQPLSKALGTALDFAGLMKLAEHHTVRYLKGITCNNIGEPLGVGLWEGVPLREVVWMAKPTQNVRRVFYYGYHNDDPTQMFQSSLSIGRVLEDPPGELPILLCYKLNGELLSGKRGGPVRMLVPEAYGFKSVKWLQRVVLTNEYRANDTYALGNNDLDSPMKTFARFAQVPDHALAGEPIRITGLAQVGMSGLARVQYWVRPQDAPLPTDGFDGPFSGETSDDEPRVRSADRSARHFDSGDWCDANILPPPEDWGGGLPNGRLPEVPLQFELATGRPHHWPLRYTVAHWTATLPGLPPGQYQLCCRTIDLNGVAQPMPRPFAKSGRVAIQQVPLIIED